MALLRFLGRWVLGLGEYWKPSAAVPLLDSSQRSDDDNSEATFEDSNFGILHIETVKLQIISL